MLGLMHAAILAFLVMTMLLPIPSRAQAQTQQWVALGDSLTAGYGLDGSQAFPEKLQAALTARGHDIVIANAGVSGDTTAGGRERLDWSVPEGTDAVILELGANDALRGLSPEQTRDNLAIMIETLKERGIAVLLAGMLAPPNMGAAYEKDFNAIYPQLADLYEIDLYPFFLDGVAAEPDLLQSDGMHPNAAGVDVIVDRFVPYMESLMSNLSAQAGR